MSKLSFKITFTEELYFEDMAQGPGVKITEMVEFPPPKNKTKTVCVHSCTWRTTCGCHNLGDWVDCEAGKDYFIPGGKSQDERPPQENGLGVTLVEWQLPDKEANARPTPQDTLLFNNRLSPKQIHLGDTGHGACSAWDSKEDLGQG